MKYLISVIFALFFTINTFGQLLERSVTVVEFFKTENLELQGDVITTFTVGDYVHVENMALPDAPLDGVPLQTLIDSLDAAVWDSIMFNIDNGYAVWYGAGEKIDSSLWDGRYVEYLDSTILFVTPTQLTDSLLFYVQYSDSLNIFVTPTQLADSLLNYVQYNDSLTVFVTPTQLVDSLNAIYPVDSVYYNINPTVGEGHLPGRAFWDTLNHTISVDLDLDGVTLQAGFEDLTLVFNNTLDTLKNGRGVYPSLIQTSATPNVEYASSANHTYLEGDLGVTTMDIPPGERGYVATRGKVRDFDTSSLSPGRIYLTANIPADGTFTNTRPSFPFYQVRMGGATSIDPLTGSMFVSISNDPANTVVNAWNCSVRETINFTVSSDGGTITGTLDAEGSQDFLTLMFSDGFTLMDVSTPPTIILTAGTDNIPQANFIYIPITTKVLTVSTSGWPAGEAIRLAYIKVKTAPTTLADGAHVNQNANDHVQAESDNRGHLLHITERLRQFPASWPFGGGIEATTTVVGSPSDVWVSTTAGFVYQLHLQSFPAQDTQTGSDIDIWNYPADAWRTVSNLNTVTVDANNITLANSSFSFVLWGIQNRTGQPSHLVINLPTGTYGKNTPQDAVNDLLKYSTYSIPLDYRSVGFLIARFTYTLDAGGNIWTLFASEDLRGTFPNSIAGASGGGAGVTSYLSLTDTEAFFEALAFQRVNSIGNSLENVLAAEIDLSEFNNDLDSTLQQSYLKSIQPHIETDLTNGSLQVKNGSGVNANATQEWLNNAGTTTASIDGDGFITSPSIIDFKNILSNVTGAQAIVVIQGNMVEDVIIEWVSGTTVIVDIGTTVSGTEIVDGEILSSSGSLKTWNIDWSGAYLSGATLHYTISGGNVNIKQLRKQLN